MTTNGTPPPTWPIEPTTRYQVSYFPTTQVNQAATILDPIMYDYGSAIERAKALMTANNNVGACLIAVVSCISVYPSIPWQDF